MLKLKHVVIDDEDELPAAFRRLCVETFTDSDEQQIQQPAAFRRLCVETIIFALPAARRRASRLQAAVC